MDRLDPATGHYPADGDDALDSAEATQQSLQDWIAAGCPGDVSVRLCGDEELEGHWAALADLDTIIVDFPLFMDGRGFSVARKLREKGFRGTLLAAGDVLPDQWSFLARCGFTALADAGVASRAEALPRIGASYQATGWPQQSRGDCAGAD